MGYRGNIELPMYKELEKGQRIMEVIKSYGGDRELQKKFIVTESLESYREVIQSHREDKEIQRG